MGAIIGAVQIRDQFMPQPQEVFRNGLYSAAALPGFFAHKIRIAGVQAVNGAENTVLKPAQIQFIILITLHMSANIMAPPSITSVGSCIGEIGLEIQAFPGTDGITGETQRIPVAAKPCIP